MPAIKMRIARFLTPEMYKKLFPYEQLLHPCEIESKSKVEMEEEEEEIECEWI